MFVEPAHYRPPSLLRFQGPDALSWLTGLAFLLAWHGAIYLTYRHYPTMQSYLDPHAIGEEPAPPATPDLPVVEAGFVELGREWDPRELPDRRIASNAEAPRAQDPDVVSAFQRLTSDAGVPPQNRALTALLDTSASYDQDGNAQMLFEQEGQAWGGDNAREGSMLLGQIESLIRRGLEVPASIPESDYAGTTARVRVVVDGTWSVSTIEFVNGSGNDDWDRAVRQRVSDIASARPRLHAQPGDEALLGQPLSINVRPRSSRRRGGAGTTTSSMNLLDTLGGGN